jgi:hypothetical protein
MMVVGACKRDVPTINLSRNERINNICILPIDYLPVASCKPHRGKRELQARENSRSS